MSPIDPPADFGTFEPGNPPTQITPLADKVARPKQTVQSSAMVKLLDGTEAYIIGLCSCGSIVSECRGGQHVGSGRLGIALVILGSEDPLLFISGMRSSHKARLALEKCTHWQEVPLAIEATGWQPLDAIPER